MNNTAEYENEINLKKLCIYILRKWKVLLNTFCSWRPPFGSVKSFFFSRAGNRHCTGKANQTKITEYQTALSTNKSTISSNKNQININEAAIEDQTRHLKTCRMFWIRMNRCWMSWKPCRMQA